MKAMIALVAAVVPMVLSYDEKFDNIDMDVFLGNDEVFNKYVNCWLDKGPCDVPFAEDYKQMIPEIMSTACSKCTPIQKQHIRKTVKALANKKPTEFNEFKLKHGPKTEHEAAFTAFLMSSE